MRNKAFLKVVCRKLWLLLEGRKYGRCVRMKTESNVTKQISLPGMG